MPTYEYVCKECGDTMEVFQSFSERPLKKHKECGGQLQKVFHARGIVFKGGGFYATDSKASSSTKSSKTDDEPKPAKDGKDTKTAEKKPATATADKD